MRPVIRREALTELTRTDLVAVGAGTRSLDCVDPTPAIASLELRTCIALSVDCYSWHTEQC